MTGLAPSASAAHTLHAALGVPTETTAKWLYEACGDGAAARAGVHDQAAADRLNGALPWREQEAANHQMWRMRAEQDTWRFTAGQIVTPTPTRPHPGEPPWPSSPPTPAHRS